MKKIKTGAISRGLSLAKLGVSAGARAASHSLSGLFSSEDDKTARLKSLVLDQVSLLSRELGQLKGSLMKVGQLLSIYGEYFLPPEANQVLKSLQSDSPPLEWRAIERQIQRQLGEGIFEKLEIEHQAVASASLGQVHRAVRKSDGRVLAMKIQYPGVDRAIDSDVQAFRSILSMARLIPSSPNWDELFKEVKSMLRQEVDYAKELEATDYFRRSFAGDPRYVVPETFPEFSNGRILTTSFEAGSLLGSPEVLSLSQERRNAIGMAALDCYFRELFELKLVQTDPHFGNYRVRIGADRDSLVLLDFGPRKQPPPHLFRAKLGSCRDKA